MPWHRLRRAEEKPMHRLITVLAIAVFALSAMHSPSLAQPKKKEPPKAGKAATKKGPVDINSASTDELKTLPGVGDLYAKKIIDGRPYKRKDELLQKKIVPQNMYSEIKDRIVAK